MLLTRFIIFMAGALLLSACQNEFQVQEEYDYSDFTAEDWEVADPDFFQWNLITVFEMPQEHVEAFQRLGLQGAEVQVFNRVNSYTSEERLAYIVDGDITVYADELMDMVQFGENVEGGRTEQYRTSNLVNDGEILLVGRLETNLGQRTRDAMAEAVANYNNLNLDISFRLEFANLGSAIALKRFNLLGLGRQYRGRIIHLRRAGGTGNGGSAGFPSNGKPFSSISIHLGTQNLSLDVNEHVITHEIGHCIGLRHTDFFSRASCGDNINEGGAGVGAIHIPGTPAMTSIDWDSNMLACFSQAAINTSTFGEFSAFDIIALNAIY